MIQDKLKQQKQAASKKVNPAKLLIANEPKRAAKATAKSKAKAKAGASSKTVIELADDAGRTDNEVAVHGVGGTAFTREKYFIDCLVMCVRSALRAARKTVGVPDELGNLTDAETGHLVYTPMELKLLRDVIKSGLIGISDGRRNQVAEQDLQEVVVFAASASVLGAEALRDGGLMHWSTVDMCVYVCVCICWCLCVCVHVLECWLELA